MMTNYICITFGPSDNVARNGWWNRKEYFDTQRAAERCGLEQMPIAGCFGYVVIEETKDSWKVVDEMGLAGASLTASHFTYSVQPAPQLRLV